jgi:LysM repeat protein
MARGGPLASEHRAARTAALLALAAATALGCAKLRAIVDPPVSAPPAPGEPVVAYVVQPGDTLARVAAWHGVAEGEAAARNGMQPGEALRPGRELLLPRRKLPTHTVAAGDTLMEIAVAYGVEPDAIAHLN